VVQPTLHQHQLMLRTWTVEQLPEVTGVEKVADTLLMCPIRHNLDAKSVQNSCANYFQNEVQVQVPWQRKIVG